MFIPSHYLGSDTSGSMDQTGQPYTLVPQPGLADAQYTSTGKVAGQGVNILAKYASSLILGLLAGYLCHTQSRGEYSWQQRQLRQRGVLTTAQCPAASHHSLLTWS